MVPELVGKTTDFGFYVCVAPLSILPDWVMKFEISGGKLATASADLIAIICPQQGTNGGTTAQLQRGDGGRELDRQLGGALSAVIDQDGFDGALGSFRLVGTHGAIPARYVLMLGGGRVEKFQSNTWRQLGATLVMAADSVKATHVAGALEAKSIRRLAPATRLEALTEGVLFAQYRCDQFYPKAKKKPSTLTTFSLHPERKSRALEQALTRGEILGRATCLARDLVNLPSNTCTPQFLAATARKVAKRKGVTCKVYDQKALATMRMNLLLAVGQGSVVPPCFIHLRYTPTGKAKRHIALVGKGVTFDTGGVNLKPTRSILNMHADMAGAASVIAAMDALAQLQPKVLIDVFVPTTENCIGSGAFKPNDVITARSGTTVEIVNTDAEGRLILADALDFAKEEKPDYIVDVATLTGGVRYALGELFTVVLGTNPGLVKQLLGASKVAGEPMWELPLVEEYLAGFQGGIAELKNCGKSGASTITGGLFLSQFVGDAAWAHLDIAESSWRNEAHALGPQGGTGSPVRTLCHFVLGL
jgi:leucyl aminopeptidase